MGYGRSDDLYLEHPSSRVDEAFPDSFSHFVSLAVSESDLTFSVADDEQGGKRHLLAAFRDLSDAVYT